MKQKPNITHHKIILWFIFTAVITAFCGLVYIALQQDMRIGANDPQIQMAEDVATALGAGEKVTPTGSVDIANSLAPFVIMYDAQGKVLSSGARLHNHIPQIPQGVFEAVKTGGEKRFTWQPEPGVRIAAVVTTYNGGGYVLAGRSLREVEKRIDQLGQLVAVIWIGTVGAVSILAVFL